MKRNRNRNKRTRVKGRKNGMVLDEEAKMDRDIEGKDRRIDGTRFRTRRENMRGNQNRTRKKKVERRE